MIAAGSETSRIQRSIIHHLQVVSEPPTRVTFPPRRYIPADQGLWTQFLGPAHCANDGPTDIDVYKRHLWSMLSCLISARSVLRLSKRNTIGNAMRSPFIFHSSSGYARTTDLTSSTGMIYAAYSAIKLIQTRIIWQPTTLQPVTNGNLRNAPFTVKII